MPFELRGRADYAGRYGDEYPEVHPYGTADILDAELRTETVEVKSTKQTGRGLFARRPFRERQEVFVFDGTKSTQDHSLLSTGSGVNSVVVGREEKVLGRHLGKFIWADPPDNSPLRYLNHSCDPNLGRSAADPFVFKALRDIRPEEQLTADYALLETNPEWGMGCACGSPDCRTRISSIENSTPEYLAENWDTIPTPMREFALERSTDPRVQALVRERGVSGALSEFIKIFPPREYDIEAAA